MVFILFTRNTFSELGGDVFYLNVIDTFSAAVELCGYQGRCSNLHGHGWKVRVCRKRASR